MRFLLFVLLALPLAAQKLDVPCEPPVDTIRKLEALPPVGEVGIPYEQRIGPLRMLAERNPGDFFIQRAYQDAFRRKNYLGEEFDRALAMYRRRSGPLATYYEARLLMYTQPKRSRDVLETLLKEHPEFVWPHVEFVEWTAMPGADRQQAAPHTKVFTAACPEMLPGDERGIVPDAAAMRRALERRDTWLDYGVWPRLWLAEEKAGIEPESRTSRIRSDLKRIESRPFKPYPALKFTYGEAARILHDESVMDALQARAERDAPGSFLASMLRDRKWTRENPPPKPGDMKAYLEYEDRHAAAEREWLRQRPNDYAALSGLWRWITFRRMSAGARFCAAENITVVDRWLQFIGTSPDAGMSIPSFETAAAQIYADCKIRLDQIPGLLDLGLRKFEIQQKYAISPEAFPPEMRARLNDWREITAALTDQIRTDYLIAVKRLADARALIEQALAKPGRDPSGRSQPNRMEWTRRLGDLEAAEGRPQEALSHYQATLGIPKERLSSAEENPHVAAIKQFYLAHGGTQDRWPEWASVRTAPAALARRTPPAFQQKLPDFEAKDLAGKTWRLGDLSGKGTLVNFWATWCGPCRAEHEYLQKLHDALRDRKDMQVLTISVDESPGAVRDYIKEKGYTFPVIRDPDLGSRLFPYVGLPTNFLVNAQGMRTNMYGFAGSEEEIRRVIEDLARAAKPTPSY